MTGRNEISSGCVSNILQECVEQKIVEQKHIVEQNLKLPPLMFPCTHLPKKHTTISCHVVIEN